jgi:small-conductance mechanosensitive channel
MSKIDLKKAIRTAFKGFSLWWIPLCLTSTIIFFNQNWLPKLIYPFFNNDPKLTPLIDAFKKFNSSLENNSAVIANTFKFMGKLSEVYNDPVLHTNLNVLIFKIAILTLILVMVLSGCYVFLIVTSKNAVKELGVKVKCQKRDFKHILLQTLSFLFLAMVKVMCIIIFIPGIYIYIRLMFSGIIITESSPNPIKAIIQSWKLTKNEFSKILVVFIICFVTDIISIITIIGFIPAEPLKYTLRTSIYEQLKKNV